MNDFTKGEWSVSSKSKAVVSTESNGIDVRGATGNSSVEYYGGNMICESVSKCNADLIATAGVSATKLAEQGYDAVKLISLLPEIAAANSMNVKVALIKQCEVE